MTIKLVDKDKWIDTSRVSDKMIFITLLVQGIIVLVLSANTHDVV